MNKKTTNVSKHIKKIKKVQTVTTQGDTKGPGGCVPIN